MSKKKKWFGSQSLTSIKMWTKLLIPVKMHLQTLETSCVCIPALFSCTPHAGAVVETTNWKSGMTILINPAAATTTTMTCGTTIACTPQGPPGARTLQPWQPSIFPLQPPGTRPCFPPPSIPLSSPRPLPSNLPHHNHCCSIHLTSSVVWAIASVKP